MPLSTPGSGSGFNPVLYRPIIAPQPVQPPRAVYLTAALLDTFSRADRTGLGNTETGGYAWSSTNFNIASNQATHATASSGSGDWATVDLGSIATSVTAAVTEPTLTYSAVGLRYVDDNNAYWVETNANGSLLLSRMIAGTQAQLVFSANFVWSGSGTLILTAVENGSQTDLAVYLDGVLLISYSDTTSGRPAGTRVGLRSFGAGSTFDNFDATAGASSSTPVALSDTGTGADSLTASATVPLAETGTGTEALTVAATAALAETGAAVDSLTVTATIPLADPRTVADALTATATVPLADAGVGSDALTVSTTMQLGETSAGADALSVAAAVPLPETGTGTDALSANATVTLADAATGTDALTVQTGTNPSLPETAAGADALTVTTSLTLGDTATGADAVTLAATVSLPELIVAVDALAVQVITTLSETAAAADALSAVPAGASTSAPRLSLAPFATATASAAPSGGSTLSDAPSGPTASPAPISGPTSSGTTTGGSTRLNPI